MKVKGAIFDMDGTLLNSLHFWNYLYNRLGEVYLNDPKFTIDPELDRKSRTSIFTAVLTWINDRYHLTDDFDGLVKTANDILQEHYKTNCSVKKGAIELLESLQNKGIKLALATGTAKNELEIALDTYGFRKYFPIILSCEQIGAGKEKPDIFNECASLMGLTPQEICVVEDSATALITAKNAGYNTIGVYDKDAVAQDILEQNAQIFIGEDKSLLDVIDLF